MATISSSGAPDGEGDAHDGTADRIGIPPAELTPRVRAAAERLLADIRHLRAMVDQLRRRSERLDHLANEDALLPVMNRRAFVRELGRMVAFARRHGMTSTLVYIDLDGMKSINDRHGHAAGDAALRRVAEALAGAVRATDAIGRVGGDEFCVLLARTTLEQGLANADRLAAAVHAQALSWNGERIPLQVSTGVALVDGRDEPEAVLALADSRMYANKRGARAAG